MGRPEMVVKRALRSADLVFVSDMVFSNNGRSPFRQESESRIDYAQGKQAPPEKDSKFGYSLRARRNDVTAKNAKRAATTRAMAMSQWATSRVQARKAALSQPKANMAKAAPVIS
jgi:hypothetical protein